MEKFSLHKWKPVLCKNAADIEDFLKKSLIPGKKISAVRTIGMANNFTPFSISLILEELKNKGFSDGEIYSEKFYSGKLMPLMAEIFEPVIFVFEDSSTFEIMNAKYQNGILVAANQISPYSTEGLNCPNYNSEYFFRKFKGMSFSGKILHNILNPDKVFQDNVFAFQLERNGLPADFFAAIECAFSISAHKDSMFSFGIKSSCSQKDYISVPAEEYLNAATGIEQARIIEGHGPGGVFEISPYSFEKDFEDIISIESGDIEDYLIYFLHKHYDPKLYINQPEKLERHLYEKDKRPFDWHGPNGFTAESMRLVLKEIKHSLNLLETDYDNPELDGLKKAFIGGNKDIPCFDSRPILAEEPKDDAARQKQLAEISKKAWIAIDFYRRFAERIETMLELCPDCEGIEFFGP